MNPPGDGVVPAGLRSGDGRASLHLVLSYRPREAERGLARLVGRSTAEEIRSGRLLSDGVHCRGR